MGDDLRRCVCGAGLDRATRRDDTGPSRDGGGSGGGASRRVTGEPPRLWFSRVSRIISFYSAWLDVSVNEQL